MRLIMYVMYVCVYVMYEISTWHGISCYIENDFSGVSPKECKFDSSF